MRIKICGVFRAEDIEYLNEARPDYAGFVFAPGRREVSFARAARLREALSGEIAAVGVFVDARAEDVAALYRDGVISLAQLHGKEDEAYIERLKEACAIAGAKAGASKPITVIKTLQAAELEGLIKSNARIAGNADYYLVDSGAGSGKTFDWNILEPGGPCASWLESSGKPWFLAGGILTENIKAAMSFNPFCVDISGGAESGGIKDRAKIVELIAMARKGNGQ